jgi:CRP/FNR family cyclic AMP-dependent transcriptional regulator
MPKRILKRDKIDVLSRLALFETCSKRELGQVASISVQAHHPAGTVLTREGQTGGLLFVIIDGEAEVIRNGKKIGTLGAGDVVGELSLIDGRARSANVRAVTDVDVLEITQDDFQHLVRQSPEFVRNLLGALAARIREMDERWPAEL